MRAEQNRPPHEHKEGETGKNMPKPARNKEEDWPELNDEFAKSFGEFKKCCRVKRQDKS